MLGGSFFHSVIGHLMDFFWLGQSIDGVKVYETSTYAKALGVIPVAAMVGCLLFLKLVPKQAAEAKPVAAV